MFLSRMRLRTPSKFSFTSCASGTPITVMSPRCKSALRGQVES